MSLQDIAFQHFTGVQEILGVSPWPAFIGRKGSGFPLYLLRSFLTQKDAASTPHAVYRENPPEMKSASKCKVSG